MKISRRSALGILATTATASAIEPPAPEPQAAAGGPLTLGWLSDAQPALETGVSWGVPWARGSVSRTQTFALTAGDGRALPLQAWPLAYWPDGSIKYTGFATVTGAPGPFRLAPGTPAAAPALKVTQSAQAIEIDTGKIPVPHPDARRGALRIADCRWPRGGARCAPHVHARGPLHARARCVIPNSPARSAKSPWSRAGRCAPP